MFVGNEGELGISDTNDQTSDKQHTVGQREQDSTITVSNSDEVHSMEAQGPSKIVTRSNRWSLIKRVS